MKNGHQGGCCGSSCDYGPFTRNHYFDGKLLVERDFTDEQSYFRDKMRHHHQRLHGFGVVCGLKVKEHPRPECRDRFVIVEPGTAIDCCGHEILVKEEVVVDVTELPGYARLVEILEEAKGEAEAPAIPTHAPLPAAPGGPPPAPRERGLPFRLCIRYRECPSEEIPVLYDECGCDETRCAPNRILESFAFDVLPATREEPYHRQTPQLEPGSHVNLAKVRKVAPTPEGEHYWVVAGDRNIHVVRADRDVTLDSRTLDRDVVDLVHDPVRARTYVLLGGGADMSELLVLHREAQLDHPAAVRIDLPRSGDRSKLALRATGLPEVPVVFVELAEDAARLHPLEIDDATGEVGGAGDVLEQFGLYVDVAVDASGGGRILALRAGDEPALDVAILEADGRFQIERTVDLADTRPVALAAIPARADAPGSAVIAEASDRRLILVDFAEETVVRTSVERLAHDPLDIVAAPSGHWLYVMGGEVRPDASGPRYLQPVASTALRTRSDAAVGEEARIADGVSEIAVANDGSRLYAPRESDAEGSIQIIAVLRGSCDDILFGTLDGCPDCDEPDCVVLSTILSYRPEVPMVDLPEGDGSLPRGPAYIHNLRGRHLLPSVQTLYEWIRCRLRDVGSNGEPIPGPPGPPGAGIDDVNVTVVECDPANPNAALAPATLVNGVLSFEVRNGCKGDPGEEGEGITQVIVDHVECDPANPNAPLDPPTLVDGVLRFQVRDGCPGADGSDSIGLRTDLAHICEISWPHGRGVARALVGRGLGIAFDCKMKRADLVPPSPEHSPNIRVLAEEPTLPGVWRELRLEFVGLRDPADIDGEPGDLPGSSTEGCEGRLAKLVPTGNDGIRGVRFRIAEGEIERLNARAELRVVVKGDFVRRFVKDDDGRHPALDGDHLPPHLPIRRSGNGTEGGDFESWFRLE